MSQRSGRMIRHAIRNSLRFARATWQEREFYYGLLTWADDYGRFDATPAIVRAGLYAPMLQKVSERDVRGLLARCHALELIKLYTVEGRGYGQVLRYDQKMAKKQALYPPPEGEPELEFGAEDDPPAARKSRPKERKKEIPPSPPPGGGSDSSVSFSRRTVSPLRAAKAARDELTEIERELEELLRPGGAAYNTRPTGDKWTRYNQLMARRGVIKKQLLNSGAFDADEPHTD
jgi:hypothetical protein